tara:strand:+ start:465 stop:674 length:210 start_codon:yes stop_codon:yes gene_type:complete
MPTVSSTSRTFVLGLIAAAFGVVSWAEPRSISDTDLADETNTAEWLAGAATPEPKVGEYRNLVSGVTPA